MFRLGLPYLARHTPSRWVHCARVRRSSFWASPPAETWWSRHPILTTLGSLTLGSALYGAYQYRQRVLVYPPPVRSYLRQALLACQRGDFSAAQEPFTLAYTEARSSPSLPQDGQAMLGLVARYIHVLQEVEDTDRAIHVLQDTLSSLLHPSSSSPSLDSLPAPKITVDLAVKLADLLEDLGDKEGCARSLLWSLSLMLSKAPEALHSSSSSSSSFTTLPDIKKAIAPWSSTQDVAAVMERLARLYFTQGQTQASLALYRRLLPLLPDSQVCERSTILVAISALTLEQGNAHAARQLLGQLDPSFLKRTCPDVYHSLVHTRRIIQQTEQGEASTPQ
ncbi:MAG: hypothetical protein DHS80DRAFT_30744 [Piptocephalis tieghemiana]|nr:MAG: hypothetical protein DHS80DRAFT_30744 [Piptocephalis tieghemiana]